MYGHLNRLLISLPIAPRAAPLDSAEGGPGRAGVNVHFIADTGAPYTYLAPEVLQRLRLEEFQLSEARGLAINGVPFAPYVTRDSTHFSGLNLLGMVRTSPRILRITRPRNLAFGICQSDPFNSPPL